MDKIIKIIFSKKSRSKSLPEALRLSKKLDGVHEDDLVRVKLTALEVFDKWEYFNSLLNVIDKWAGFEIYYKDRICRTNKEYRNLYYALQELKYCYLNTQSDPVDFEKCNPQWGCHKIKSISLRLTGTENLWYEYGTLGAKDTWIINKEKILNEIQYEISQKYLTVCPAFSMARIRKVIQNLPETLPVGEEWVVSWSMEMIDGALTKVYSIYYDREFEEDCNYVEKITAKIPLRVECPHKKGTDQWLDWMLDKGYLKGKQDAS